VIRGLRPIYLDDLGLLAALEILARETEPAAGVSVSFQTDGLPVRLTPEREIAIFRIAQEALSNVTRHAQARHVDMGVEFGEGRLTITIRDNGKGFSRPPAPADLASAGHYGLLGMQERAELIGAALQIESSPGNGTKVVLVVPHSLGHAVAPFTKRASGIPRSAYGFARNDIVEDIEGLTTDH
jgi:two-component system sensor histidine kinase UhpB